MTRHLDHKRAVHDMAQAFSRPGPPLDGLLLADAVPSDSERSYQIVTDSCCARTDSCQTGADLFPGHHRVEPGSRM